MHYWVVNIFERMHSVDASCVVSVLSRAARFLYQPRVICRLVRLPLIAVFLKRPPSILEAVPEKLSTHILHSTSCIT